MTTTSKLVDYLNNLLETDPAAIHCLFINRVPANQGLVDHPTAICDSLSQKPVIGIMGILNGFLSSQNEPLIEMVFEDNSEKGLQNRLIKFQERGESVSIIINGKTYSVNRDLYSNVVTYDVLMKIGEFPYSSSSDYFYTVTCYNPRTKQSRIVDRRSSIVKLEDGLIFNISNTSNA